MQLARARPRRFVLWVLVFAVVLLLVAFSTHLHGPFFRPLGLRPIDVLTPTLIKRAWAQAAPTTTKLDPFRVPWGAFVSQPSGRRVQVISVSQDHRPLPATPSLPADLRSRTFRHLLTATAATAASAPANSSDENRRLHIFQIHLAVESAFFDVEGDIETPSACTFQTVELWWPSLVGCGTGNGNGNGNGNGDGGDNGDNGDDGQEEEELGVEKLTAEAITLDEPLHAAYRYQHARPQYLELIVRCAFLLSDDMADQLLRRRRDVRFAVFAAREVAFFPLDHVLHFPRPAGLLPVTPTEKTTARDPQHHHHGLATAPWANSSGVGSVVRASGADARVRVGAWITKKFTWTADDELWLLWTLDVVGVDHVVLHLATRQLSLESVRQRLARHAGVLERVTLVGVDAPGRDDRVTYCYLQELLVWDGFVRWQADFDYVLLVDTDEFVQLFEREAPHRRVDAKTFIARNRDRLHAGGHAYMNRLRVGRTRENSAVEAQLPAFLDGVIAQNGAQIRELADASGGGREEQGKSLFFANGAVKPYLHWSVGYPTKLWRWEEAHILHVRKFPYGVTGTLTWWLPHLAGHVNQTTDEDK